MATKTIMVRWPTTTKTGGPPRPGETMPAGLPGHRRYERFPTTIDTTPAITEDVQWNADNVEWNSDQVTWTQ